MPLPPLSRQTVSHGAIAYREGASSGGGTGKLPLILLHGLGGASPSWEHQLEHFGRTRRVIAWDCPGYGGSDDLPNPKPDLDEFAIALGELLDALGIEQADMVGHSMGGAIAPRFTIRQPGRVRKLVLSCTRAGFRQRDPGSFAQRVEELRTQSAEEFGRRRAESMTSPSASEAIRAKVAAIAAQARLSGYEAAVHMLMHADNTELLGHVRVPTLVLSATDDRVATAAEADQLAGLISGAERTVIEGAGHAPYLEKPDVYNGVLERFFA